MTLGPGPSIRQQRESEGGRTGLLVATKRLHRPSTSVAYPRVETEVRRFRACDGHPGTAGARRPAARPPRRILARTAAAIFPLIAAGRGRGGGGGGGALGRCLRAGV